MANNAFDAYMMFNNGFRKAIVKAPEHAAGTVVDIVVDGVDKVERLAGNTRTALLPYGSNATPEKPTSELEKEKTLADLFGEELSETFHRTESGDGMYAAVSYEAEGIKQQYLILIATDEKAAESVKVIPVVPSGYELFGYSKKKPFKKASTYGVKSDKDNPGEVFLDTMRMRRIVQRYKTGEVWTKGDVKEYIQEIADWTQQMSPQRKEALERRSTLKGSENALRSRNRFEYASGSCKRCRKIVISDRAYTSIIAEALSRDPDETGGILLGIVDKDVWYVVEATDPGLSTFHNRVHHEMDDKYHNHVYPVISRLYENDLCLLGLWHRHPGTLNTFSGDDNRTNASYSDAIGNGTLSFLLNFVPDGQLTCYYLDGKGSGSYYKPEVRIGDKYFKGTDYLGLADVKTLIARKKQMQQEIKVG